MFPQKKGPWQVLDSEIKYQNPWIKVTEDSVIRPDGQNGTFGVVTMKPGVSVLPMDSMGNVYLTVEYKYAVGRDVIEVISGGCDNGEDFLSAAKRELLEEAGIIATEFIDLGFIDPFTSVINSPNHLYLATGLQFTASSPEGTEIIKILKVPFSEAVDWAMNSKITHGASVALILKASQN